MAKVPGIVSALVRESLYARELHYSTVRRPVGEGRSVSRKWITDGYLALDVGTGKSPFSFLLDPEWGEHGTVRVEGGQLVRSGDSNLPIQRIHDRHDRGGFSGEVLQTGKGLRVAGRLSLSLDGNVEKIEVDVGVGFVRSYHFAAVVRAHGVVRWCNSRDGGPVLGVRGDDLVAIVSADRS